MGKDKTTEFSFGCDSCILTLQFFLYEAKGWGGGEGGKRLQSNLS